MTHVTVYAGACGEQVEVEVEQLDPKHVCVTLVTNCHQVGAMNPDLVQLKCLGRGHEVFLPFDRSAVYQSAMKHNLHIACPVPSAILRAIEATLGLAVARDITITFQSAQSGEAEEE